MRRVMLKLSGEALAGDDKTGFDFKFVDNVCKQIKKAHAKKIQIVLMVGGGNFIRGKMLSNIDKYKADSIGMLSTCMNALYVSEVLRLNGLESEVYGAFSISDMCKRFSKNEANNDLKNNKIVIFATGTGHPYFTTDTGVALRSIELNCDELLMAKSIDGVYDKDPVKYKDAKKYDKISLQEMVDKKLEVIDLSASTFCLMNNIKIRIFDLKAKDSILKAINGAKIGTLIY